MKGSRREFVKRSALGTGGLILGAHHFGESDFGGNLKMSPMFASRIMDIDLMNDESEWTPFTPREEISPVFTRKEECKKAALEFVISGNNNPYSVGCWQRILPELLKDHHYYIEASFHVENVADKNKSVRAIVTKNKNEYVELNVLEKSNDWFRLSTEFSPNQNEGNLEVCLYLIESATGTINWRDVKIKDVTETFSPRLVSLAAISGRPVNPENSSEAVEFYCERIDKIRDKDLDLVCLGEFINVEGVPGDKAVLAEPIPGPSTERLGEKARQYNTYIVTSLQERDGKLIYNTAVLIDRSGEVVGKYRKIHLTIGEQLIWGVKPGNDYPVFQTDFGKVGIMVCYDNHYPEVARILAVKGAELIAYPNQGDGREWPNGARGSVWEPYMRTRAIDSHVAIVSAVNSGRSCIVNGGGEILAVNKYANEERGAIVQARVDLNASVINGTGRTIQKRYILVRRPESYEPLTKHRWDFE